MKRVTHESERELKMIGARLVASVLLMSANIVVAAHPVVTQQTPADTSEQTPNDLRTSASQSQEGVPKGTAGDAPGMMIYIDPKTGAFLKEPVPGYVPLPLTPQLRNSVSTSHEGLAEVPSSVPGGGFKLDLQGRFQSPLVVVIDEDGKVQMQHLTEAPKSADNK
jgi:hypothetical protein